MKSLRPFCAALMLTLALTTAAFAGNMTTMSTDPPPPPSTATQGEMSTTCDGNMSTGVTDTATEIALNLLQSLLALF